MKKIAIFMGLLNLSVLCFVFYSSGFKAGHQQGLMDGAIMGAKLTWKKVFKIVEKQTGQKLQGTSWQMPYIDLDDALDAVKEGEPIYVDMVQRFIKEK